MAPSVSFTSLATPELPVAPCVSAPQLTVEPLPRVQSVGAALVSQLVKFCVVPELSLRWTTVMVVLGSFALGLSVLIAASSQVLIAPEKIFAAVSAERFSFTPERLYDTVIGATTVGK